jgi:Protein of unknown function (DUF1553)/Protein of unknown function (DUF1549)/Planctomycete cytochrome C
MRSLLLISLLLLFATPAFADFEREVKPLLAKHCVSCHGPKLQRSSLRLDSATAIHAGGSNGEVVLPGKSGESLVVKMVECAKGVKPMPPKGPRLSASEVAVLRRWIDDGAKIPAREKIVASRRGASHWAFQPVRHFPLPAVKDAAWTRTAIDRFILARLEKEGIRPSPEADRVTLLRRASLDLIGLPPTIEEVKAFLADARPDAYERQVDRLLASPHYGERWGRHWLDQARYADSNGYSIDSPRSIWKFRDWVIGALNADLPFDRFTVEQLAGDLLPGATMEQRVATGFHRNTQVNEEGGIDVEQFRVEAIVDRTNTTGSVWLGLTVGCAQCHDHKYDPIAQKEYYQLYAFFNNSDDPRLEIATDDALARRHKTQAEIKRLETALFDIDRLNDATLEKWEGGLSADVRKTLPARIQAILAIPVNGRSKAQEQALWTAYRRADQVRHVAGGFAGPIALAAQTHLLTRRVILEKQIAQRKKTLPNLVTTMVLDERPEPRLTTVQFGGDFLRKGPEVRPGTLGVLPNLPSMERGKTRLDLARWLVDGKNPLTGRVLVNRLWQHHFGQGLVETENDFGTQGTPPTHPELLDWLAGEFVRRGWSLKQMHRLLLTSAVYRQASIARVDAHQKDPRNLLLARQNRFRLEAEIVRDVSLAASGLLTSTVGGPGVFPPQPKGVYSLTQVPKNWVADLGTDRYRRGMYTFFWRSAPHPGLTIFDAPDATAACTKRNRSNTPLQALTLLNDEAALEAARAFAERVTREPGDDAARLAHAFRLVVSRSPSTREAAILARVLKDQRAALADETKADETERAAWVQLSRVLLNLDEFITRE